MILEVYDFPRGDPLTVTLRNVGSEPQNLASADYFVAGVVATNISVCCSSTAVIGVVESTFAVILGGGAFHRHVFSYGFTRSMSRDGRLSLSSTLTATDTAGFALGTVSRGSLFHTVFPI